VIKNEVASAGRPPAPLRELLDRVIGDPVGGSAVEAGMLEKRLDGDLGFLVGRHDLRGHVEVLDFIFHCRLSLSSFRS